MRTIRLNLILAHQFINQFKLPVREAVHGNTGTNIVFLVGTTDAMILEKTFQPEFGIGDLLNLPNYHIYLKLMVDGVISNSFSATTLPQLNSFQS